VLAGTFTVPNPVYIYKDTSKPSQTVTISAQPGTSVTITPSVSGCGTDLTFSPSSLTFNDATLAKSMTMSAAAAATPAQCTITWQLSGPDAGGHNQPAATTVDIKARGAFPAAVFSRWL
jgi:hypothetical protein